jgi:hypothetical protein
MGAPAAQHAERGVEAGAIGLEHRDEGADGLRAGARPSMARDGVDPGDAPELGA